jgi:hypothetical protein
MGLGGLWQNISWLLTTQEQEMVINLHLSDLNYKKFMEIFECFAESKYPIHTEKKELIHFDIDYNISWIDNLKRLKIKNYNEDEIQTVPCNLVHEYYPVRFTNVKKNDTVCYYFLGPEEKIQGQEYSISRNIQEEDRKKIIASLKNPIELGNHCSIAENCEKILASNYCIGREGGWTHVAHSCKIDYYPVMYVKHPALEYAHGIKNKYLKEFTFVKDYNDKCSY